MKHGQIFKTAVSQCARAPTPHSSKCFVSDSVFSTLESVTFRDTMSLIKSFQCTEPNLGAANLEKTGLKALGLERIIKGAAPADSIR